MMKIATIIAMTLAITLLTGTQTASAQSDTPSNQAEIKTAILNHPRLVLKNGAYFLVMDEEGLMPAGTAYGYGLYKDDTRYLSSYNMTLNGKHPVLLSASTDEGYAGHFIYGNEADKSSGLAEQQLLLKRDIVISDQICEKITVTNYGAEPLKVDLAIEFANDFADMFEVRGSVRKLRGKLQPPEIKSPKNIVLSYKGLDEKTMSSDLKFSIAPDAIENNRVRYQFALDGQQSRVIDVLMKTTIDGDPAVFETDFSYDRTKEQADLAYKNWLTKTAVVTTSNTAFNRLIERSVRDIYILRQPTPKGNCLAAGVPWFSVAFGRDQEITALETMLFFPDLARDIIDVLAAYQGTKTDEYTEERPGRIMHELRLGEMARLREIPFIPYYGTVDATPLYLVLIGRYFEQTGDKSFVQKHWVEIERALEYLESQSASGYLRYGGKPGAALSNQGWKDSYDSVMYSDGRLAKPPIALCEVQGYLYYGWWKTAQLAELLGHDKLSKDLSRRAADLKARFLQDFWMKDKACLAIALDGDGKQCDVVSSNAGQVLNTGILPQNESRLVADAISRDDMFCGWGIRTLSSKERAYNPMSYHDGSVWPHDNAIIVEGLCRNGRMKEAQNVLTGLFETANFRDDLRLPELFCGFAKPFSDKPVWYPVSCAPQAWAAGSVFQMLSSCLGLVADAAKGELRIVRPSLPDWLEEVEIRGIRVAEAVVDLKFTSENGKTKCTVLSVNGKLKVVVQE